MGYKTEGWQDIKVGDMVEVLHHTYDSIVFKNKVVEISWKRGNACCIGIECTFNGEDKEFSVLVGEDAYEQVKLLTTKEELIEVFKDPDDERYFIYKYKGKYYGWLHTVKSIPLEPYKYLKEGVLIAQSEEDFLHKMGEPLGFLKDNGEFVSYSTMEQEDSTDTEEFTPYLRRNATSKKEVVEDKPWFIRHLRKEGSSCGGITLLFRQVDTRTWEYTFSCCNPKDNYDKKAGIRVAKEQEHFKMCNLPKESTLKEIENVVLCAMITAKPLTKDAIANIYIRLQNLNS